jgi:hypothetical protein
MPILADDMVKNTVKWPVEEVVIFDTFRGYLSNFG